MTPVAFGIKLKVIAKYRSTTRKGCAMCSPQSAVSKHNAYSVLLLDSHHGLYSEHSILKKLLCIAENRTVVHGSVT